MVGIPDEASLQELFAAADERHHRRRKRTLRIYRMVDWIFFSALLILAVLVVGRFASAVLPEVF